MKILIDIGHPAHVHFFKNAIWSWNNKGYEVKITARKKDVTIDLLDAYGFEYACLGMNRKGLVKKALGMARNDYLLYKIAKEFRPDVLLGIHDPYIAQVGKLIGKPSIIFTDTEPVRFNWLVFPFASVICTPSCFRRNIGQKQVRYEGYHELAYLHPKYFKPDPTVLEDLGINSRFIVLRFISWSAYHDVSLRGFHNESEIELVKTLENYGHVFITSEKRLCKKLEKYKLKIPPEKIHSLLYYADLYIGEGGTMAVEAAVLGTPSIHIEATSSGIATGELSGNFLELRNRYNLLYFYPDQNQALEKAISILEDKNSKKKWRRKRKELLKDKINVTAWMTNFVEEYANSF